MFEAFQSSYESSLSSRIVDIELFLPLYSHNAFIKKFDVSSREWVLHSDGVSIKYVRLRARNVNSCRRLIYDFWTISVEGDIPDNILSKEEGNWSSERIFKFKSVRVMYRGKVSWHLLTERKRTSASFSISKAASPRTIANHRFWQT